MNFSELESLMSSRGVNTLAEIARTLNTTPQAVSNWKARNQVPHHIAAKLSQLPPTGNPQTFDGPPIHSSPVTHYALPSVYEENTISLSNILLIISEQFKVILLTTFASFFLTFCYVTFIKVPIYMSKATILIPSNNNLGGLSGLASQFGVNMNSVSGEDLSSPSLYPELLGSRVFAEEILDKIFYTKKYDKELSLLAILTHGDEVTKIGKDTLVTKALSSLNQIIALKSNAKFSTLEVKTTEPLFSKQLAETALEELNSLNRYYKSQIVHEKITFITNRIASVKNELSESEKRLKEFNQTNRQISSPSLQLEQSRLSRDVEIQKGIYLTLKQQLELSKIEEIQEASIVQILDFPQVPLGPSNKNTKMSILFSIIFGVSLGIIFSFIRAYFDNDDIAERKKLRRAKYFIKKKTKEITSDYRVFGIVTVLLLVGLPLFIGHVSKNPIYFNRYSMKLLIVNVIYILILIYSFTNFISLLRIKRKK